MRRRTIESAMVNAARERATDAAARTAERDELDSQRSSGPSDERIKTERRNPAAAFLRRRARSGAPPCIITPAGNVSLVHSTTPWNGERARERFREQHTTRGTD